MARKWPDDPNFWLLVGICLYGLLALGGFVLTMTGILTASSPVHVGLLLVLPGAGFLLVLGLHLGSQRIQFHPIMLCGCLVILALALLVYLNFTGVL